MTLSQFLYFTFTDKPVDDYGTINQFYIKLITKLFAKFRNWLSIDVNSEWFDDLNRF